MNLSADCLILKFQYSMVDAIDDDDDDDDDDIDEDMWDYRKLFLDFSISYFGGI